MNKEKTGFVYIWFDRKHKRYYVGCHWGQENDGCVCSSNWMRDVYKRRPQDFKRRILKRNINTREQTYIEEQRYFDMIKPEELRKRYYNLNIKNNNTWHKYDENIKTVGQKISASPLRSQRISEANKGREVSIETRQKLRELNLGKITSEETKERISSSQLLLDRKRPDLALFNKNREYSIEERNQRSQRSKKLHIEGKIGMKNKSHSEDTKRKIGEANRLRSTGKKQSHETIEKRKIATQKTKALKKLLFLNI